MARYGAYLVGLANRHYYTTSSKVQQESLTLPQRPDGYDDLCRLVMSGDLRDPHHISDLCETFFAGVEQWAATRGIVFEETRAIPF